MISIDHDTPIRTQHAVLLMSAALISQHLPCRNFASLVQIHMKAVSAVRPSQLHCIGRELSYSTGRQTRRRGMASAVGLLF